MTNVNDKQPILNEKNEIDETVVALVNLTKTLCYGELIRCTN